jgi:hypothetical protein
LISKPGATTSPPPSHVPFRPGTVRGFAVTADGKTLVNVAAR